MTALIVMTTLRNWLKDFSQRTPRYISNCWAQKIYSKWAKALREHMDELNLTEIRLLTDNRDTLCEELCKCVVEIRNSVNCSDRSDTRGHKRQLTSKATATYATAFT